MQRIQRIEENGGLDYLVWREGSEGTVEIFDIAVTSHRKQGIGRRLVERLKEEVKPQFIFAFTREGNSVARSFYKGIGFTEIAIIKGFYGTENGVMVGIKL